MAAGLGGGWLLAAGRVPLLHGCRRPAATGIQAEHCLLAGLPLAEMQAAHPGITEGVYGVLSVAASVASRTSYGGTAPANVARMAAEWQERLA